MHVDTNTLATPLFRYERLLTSGLLRPEEKDTILKSLSYHSILTKPKRSAHLMEFKISIHLRWSGPEKLNHMLQRSKPKLLDSMAENSILYVPMAEKKNCLPSLQSTPYYLI